MLAAGNQEVRNGTLSAPTVEPSGAPTSGALTRVPIPAHQLAPLPTHRRLSISLSTPPRPVAGTDRRRRRQLWDPPRVPTGHAARVRGHSHGLHGRGPGGAPRRAGDHIGARAPRGRRGGRRGPALRRRRRVTGARLGARAGARRALPSGLATRSGSGAPGRACCIGQPHRARLRASLTRCPAHRATGTARPAARRHPWFAGHAPHARAATSRD